MIQGFLDQVFMKFGKIKVFQKVAAIGFFTQ